MYQLHDNCSDVEQLENDSDEEVVAANYWLLPSTRFDGLWESLVYDDNIKNNVIIASQLYCTVLLQCDFTVDSDYYLESHCKVQHCTNQCRRHCMQQ